MAGGMAGAWLVWMLVGSAAASTPDVRTWTVDDGLPQNTVTGVTRSTDGFLWVTTFEGVARFDGDHFWQPSVTDAQGRAVLRWTHAKAAPDGTIWFASQEQGVFVVRDGKTFEPVPGGPTWATYLETAGDAIWVTGEQTLYRCTDRCVAQHTVTDEAELRNGPKALFLVDGDSTERLVGPESPVPDHAGSRKAVGWVWDAASGAVANVDSPAWSAQVGPYPPRTVEVIGDTVWIGTETMGLMRLRDSPIERVTLPGNAAMLSVAVDAGLVLVAPSNPGILAVENGVPTPFTFPEEVPYITSLTQDSRGTWWAASGQGVFALDLETFTANLVPLPDLPGPAAQATHDGDALWAVMEADDTLVRYVPGQPVEQWPLPEPWRQTVFEPDGEGGLWYGGHTGAWHLADGKWTPLLLDGRPLSEVRDIHIDGPTTWIGTYGSGLLRLHEGVVRKLGPAQGLCDDVVSRIQRYGDSLWMNSNVGVFEVPLEELEAAAAGRGLLSCSVLPTGEGNGRGGTADNTPDGRLWFNTIEGIVAVDPTGHAETPTTARIERVRTDTLELRPGTTVRSDPGSIIVEVGSTNLVSDARREYRHRLIGADDSWVPVGDQTRSTWSALPAGRYTFEVQARSGGEWSESASFSFAIAPHWTERPITRLTLAALAAASIIALMLLFIRWRTAYLALRYDRLSRTMTLLGEREGRLRALFEAASNGLLLHDPDGRIVEVNPAACWLTEQARHELLGKLPEDFVSQGVDRYRSLLETTGTAEAAFAGHPVLLRSTRIKWDGVWHYLVSATDMTEQRREQSEREHLESRLRQTRSLQSIAALSGRVAHDVNDLLALVVGEADLLALRHPEAEPHVEAIRAASTRGTRLTERLSAFANHGSVHPEVVQLSRSLKALEPTVRTLVPDNVEVVVEGRAPPVEIDPTQFEKIVMNLAVNAGDAMPSGGTLSFVLARQVIDETTAEAHAVQPGNFTRLDVQDTGDGIPPEIQEKMFDIFFTTKDPSLATGLGLPTVNAAVRAAGGFVSADSAPGKGTRFTVYLPASLKRDTQPDAAAGQDLTEVRVLVCAKDARIADVVSRMVSSLGCIVRTEPDAPSALRSMAIPTDVLITDARLHHMLGEKLAERCREIRPDLKVLLLSALGDDETAAYPVLPKPFSRKELAATLIDLTS